MVHGHNLSRLPAGNGVSLYVLIKRIECRLRGGGEDDAGVVGAREVRERGQRGYSKMLRQGLHFVEENHGLHLGCPPFRNDLVTGIDGLDFYAAGPRREVVTHDGLPINFFGLADLKANKRASGRPRDLGDLEKILLP